MKAAVNPEESSRTNEGSTMRLRKLFAATLTAAAFTCVVGDSPRALLAQPRGPAARGVEATQPRAANATQSPFVGSWTYRSFVSDPSLATQPNELLFGSGTLVLTVPTPDQLGGTLGGAGWSLAL